MRLIDIKPGAFFPGSVITTRFGWDPVPPGPRIHHAVDRAGTGIVCLPFDAERAEFIRADAQGNSVLRLFAAGGALELRLLHFLPGELSGEIQAACHIKRGRPLPAGTPIGPAGNAGLSVSVTGGDGRHVHYSLLLSPGAYDAELSRLAPGWSSDASPAWRAQYGEAFDKEKRTRGIRWINGLALIKHDPWTGKDRIIVNTASVMGL